MFHGLQWLSVCVLCLVLAAECRSQTTSEPEFRIESQIYAIDSDVPVSQNVTLFTRGMVYDFQMSDDATPVPVEIVMFEQRKRELTLLDVRRQLRWKIGDLELLKLVDELRHETAQHPEAAFLVNERFTEEHDWSSNQASLTSETIRYVVEGTRPDDTSILPRYYAFLEHFTRLSAADPKRLPPFPRLQLNQTIKKLGWIPAEVKIDVSANQMFQRPFSAKSTHVLLMSLSDSDRQRIEYARQCWSRFSECSLAEYRNLPESPSRAEKLTNRLTRGDKPARWDKPGQNQKSASVAEAPSGSGSVR